MEREGAGLRASTHHRVVMHVRANLSEVFASYSFECRSMSLGRCCGFVPPREYVVEAFGVGRSFSWHYTDQIVVLYCLDPGGGMYV